MPPSPDNKSRRFVTSLSLLRIVSTTALSLLSGLVGGAAVISYIGTSAAPSNVHSIIVGDKSSAPQATESTTALQTLYEQTVPSTVAIYSVKQPETDVAAGLPSSLRILPDGAQRATGVVLTSDGWILVPTSALKDTTLPTLRIADQEKNTYVPTTRIDDPALEVSYLKIDARSLRPAQFASDLGLSYQKAYIVEGRTQIREISLSQRTYQPFAHEKDAIQSTVVLSKRYNPTEAFSTVGAPLVTAQGGTMIGITGSQGIIPLAYVSMRYPGVLRSGKPSGNGLALRYLDNAWVNFSEGNASIHAKGATIISDKKITLKGPAGTPSLSQGDVIIGVNDETIDINRSLSDILQTYASGETVQLTVLLQNATRSTMQVTLP